MDNRILVVGDIILDIYCSGSVVRVSPEAPVPVIKMSDKRSVLGGSGNVANNIKALGQLVSIAGIIGNDPSGYEVSKLLKDNHIEVANLKMSNAFHTLTKARMLGNGQQIVRLDCNEDGGIDSTEHKSIIGAIEKEIKNYNVIVISDYAKGMCTKDLCSKIIDLCKKNNKKIIIDPKGTNWEKYSGAYIITPNLKEISEYMSQNIKNEDAVIERLCKNICSELNIENVLITRSEKGMTLIQNNAIYHFSSTAKEVYDVSGAGDTVVAALAVALNCGKDLYNSINIANTAAGIVVGKKGTAVCNKKELDNVLQFKSIDKIVSKIMKKEELIKCVGFWRAQKESIAFTNGCYDIFHKGHVYSIYSAAEYGTRLIVALNSDDSVKRLKGNSRPINNQYDRAYVIAALGCVDAVIIFEEDTPAELLKDICPDVLVKGNDYQEAEVIGREYAGRVELVPYIDGYSSTKIINQISE